ncbi:MAG: 3-phosphoshikimate 1-carboxyvinyltransferase [Gammaproteobacteria bacterium]
MDLIVEPTEYLSGDVVVPGDKSISHRALMLGSLSEGQTDITHFLPGLDCLSTLNIFRQLGVQITEHSETSLSIQGVGLNGLRDPGPIRLDCGNSGTTLRLMAGILAAQSFSSTLTGDEGLTKRPMQRIVTPLREMGADIRGRLAHQDCYPPIEIEPVSRLKSINYVMPLASAQLKSSLLLAGLCGQAPVRVHEPLRSRDHTERMMQAFGVPLKISRYAVEFEPVKSLKATSVSIPGDISSAAFLMVGAAMSPGSELWIRGVGINPTRTGIIDLLKQMGAEIEILNVKPGVEPIADLNIIGKQLVGIDVPLEVVVRAIDEFPAFFIAAASATGRTTLKGALELRVKESDRIHKMAIGLRQLGITVFEQPDGLIVEGGSFQGGEIDCDGDHRIAMAFAMAALQAEGPIKIRKCDNILTSFPNFVELIQSIGLNISRESE